MGDLLLEIRAAEGGDDAKLLVPMFFEAYYKRALKYGLNIETTEERPGYLAAVVQGEMAEQLFKNEAGGHRMQRVPPTEKRGRVHTSTVTVAILPLKNDGPALKMSDIAFTAIRGTGPGGQHRNTTNSCIVAVHTPTQIQAKADMRSQHQSKATALKILTARVREHFAGAATYNLNENRKSQIGSGMRGDKVRTYRERDDQAKDHRTGRMISLWSFMNGDLL